MTARAAHQPHWLPGLQPNEVAENSEIPEPFLGVHKVSTTPLQALPMVLEAAEVPCNEKGTRRYHGALLMEGIPEDSQHSLHSQRGTFILKAVSDLKGLKRSHV